MSQQELATAINVAKFTFGRLEEGFTQPIYQTLLCLYRAYDTPLTIDVKYNDHQYNILSYGKLGETYSANGSVCQRT